MDIFATRLAAFGDAPALVDELGRETSYAALARQVQQAAADFGDSRRLILIEASNSVATVVAYLSALSANQPVIMTSGSAPAAILTAFEPAIVVSDGNTTFTGRAPSPMHPELALLLSTSGSTGSAKLVRLSRGNLEANALAIADVLAIGPGDRAITTLPLGYSYGLSVLNSHLAAGAAVILTDRSLVDEDFWLLATSAGATSLAGVPYSYELLDQTGFRARDLPALRTLTQAGGRLPPERARAYAAWAREQGKRFVMMYGQTEATARIAWLRPELAERWPDCIGEPLPGGALSLDPDGGELIYTGPNVMLGYASGLADLARGPEVVELRTGDLGEMAAPGIFRITGRASRFSKIAGMRIAHDELEMRLADLGIAAIVTGDDTMIAVGVADPASAAEAAAIVQSAVALPQRRVTVVPYAQLPRTGAGKLDIAAVLATAHAARAAAAPPAADFADVFSRLLGRPARSGDSFASLGGDSLSYVEASIAVETRLGTLPSRWERLTIAQLETLSTEAPVARSTATRTLSTDILVRAAAICGIVIHHGWQDAEVPLAGGALSLMMVAGFMLNRFQRDRLLSDSRWSVLTQFAARLLVPYYLVVTAVAAAQPAMAEWWFALPIGNLVPIDRGLLRSLWFIEALFQITLAVVVLFAVPTVRRAAVRYRWRFAVLLLLATVALHIACQTAWPEQAVSPGHLRRPQLWAIPLTLGWAVSEADTWSRRALCMVAAVLFPLLAYGSQSSQAVWLPIAVAAILFLPQVRLWRPAATAVAGIAASAFFIFLTHRVTLSAVWKLTDPQQVVVPVIAALVVGIASRAAWGALLRLRLFRRPALAGSGSAAA